MRIIRYIIIIKRALLPSQQRTLTTLGKNIKYARLRRDLSSEQVAERAGISRNTLIKIEKRDEGVAIGYYFRVLAVLGLDRDILLVAKMMNLVVDCKTLKILADRRRSFSVLNSL